MIRVHPSSYTMSLDTYLHTRERLLQLSDRFLADGDLNPAVACLSAAIDLSQTHLHGLVEDAAVDRRVASIAVAAFGPRRVRIPPAGKRLQVGFVIRHLLDTRGGGKSHFHVVDGLRKHGFDTFFYVPDARESQLHKQAVAAGIPVRGLGGDLRPLSLARALRQALESDGIDMAFNYDMGDWLGGALALSGGEVPVTLFHHNTDHLFAAGIHLFECHLALRRLALVPCRTHGESAFCHYLPLPGPLRADDRPPRDGPSREALGLPKEAIISITVTTLSKVSESAIYFECMDRVLRAHPSQYHVIVGAGDDGQVRFVEQQVAAMQARDRVRMLGRRTDVQSLLGLADVFVDSYPIGGMTACMEAMQSGLPVLTLSEDRNPLFSGEEALELPECIAPTREEFVRRLGVLVESAEQRQWLGGRLREIYARTFDPDVVVAQYATFLRELPGLLRSGPEPARPSEGQRLLYAIQLGNPNERKPLDYAADAMELACMRRRPAPRIRSSAGLVSAFPGLLLRRRFWGALSRKQRRHTSAERT
jgi:hypothetical protein